MSKIDETLEIPDEMLESIVGGALSNHERDQFQSVTQKLKKFGLPYENAMAWWHQQTGNYFSDEDWEEIEGIVKSVYEV